MEVLAVPGTVYTEMIPLYLILGVSVVLFFYWLRYSCLLILETRLRASGSSELAQQRGFAFPWVMVTLRHPAPPVEVLDRLRESLDADYRLLRRVLSAAPAAQDPVEDWLLRGDYRMLQVWYWLTRRRAPRRARAALAEMATILGYLAQPALTAEP
ncbi:MAG: hypothetical protein IPM24_03260 [Bryobacterales bacterium]|nr:hypothetical protein [Bryobacterales bacterium]